MATIALQYPRIAPGYLPYEQVEVGSLPVVAAQTFGDASVLILSGGQVEQGATNPAGSLAGLALHASGAVYAPVGSPTKYSTPFGVYTNTGTALVPSEPLNAHFAYFHNGQQFVFSLNTSVALAQALVGTEVGLVLAASGIWCVDTAGTNKVATIKSIVQGPNFGIIGTDSGGLVVVDFIPSTLAI